MERQNYSANLRLLCSYYGPITRVSKGIGINRQQFNKYLSGISLPAQHNHRRICDFFGVDSHEIVLPPERFAELVRLRPPKPRQSDALVQTVHDFVDRNGLNSSSLIKYHGYYYKYFKSFSSPGYILRSLVYAYPHQGRTLYKTIERIKRPEDTRSFTFKYNGIMFPVGERLHMLDHESILRNEISQTILYPTYLNRVSYLSGLMLGVSGNEAHQPVSARVIMVHLGNRIDRRAALEVCGLQHPDDDALDPVIRKGVDNELADGAPFLNAVPR
jgi:hypothetical protein